MTQHRMGVLVTLTLAAVACSGCPDPAFTRQIEARHAAQELLVHFTKASDATNRTVLADTERAAAAFASEARDQEQAVESGREALAKLLAGLEYSEELRLLQEFRRAYGKYLELDREILELAVEKTNLQAQRLSFGPVRAAGVRLRRALDGFPAGGAAAAKAADCTVHRLGLEVSLAISQLEAMHVRHIAESQDKRMDELEAEMSKLEADARRGLTELRNLKHVELQADLDEAESAVQAFTAAQKQLLVLSRRNSNVRSLELALGPKPPLTNDCEHALRGLIDRLAARQLTATR